MTFDDNALLPVLYGNHDRHLVRIEQLANVQLSARGNQLAIAGSADDAAVAHKAIAGLYERLKRGLSIEIADVDAAVRFARTGADGGDSDGIRTRRRTVQARSPGQRTYLTALARARHGVRAGAGGQRQDLSRRRHGRVAADWPARSSASCCRGRRSRPASGWASCPAT